MAKLSDADARMRAVRLAAQLPTNLPDALLVLGYAVDLARFVGGQTEDVREGTTPIPTSLRRPARADAA